MLTSIILMSNWYVMIWLGLPLKAWLRCWAWDDPITEYIMPPDLPSSAPLSTIHYQLHASYTNKQMRNRTNTQTQKRQIRKIDDSINEYIMPPDLPSTNPLPTWTIHYLARFPDPLLEASGSGNLLIHYHTRTNANLRTKANTKARKKTSTKYKVQVAGCNESQPSWFTICIHRRSL